MDSADTFAWFQNNCRESAQPGIQLVAVQREADGPTQTGRIYIDAQGRVWLNDMDYLAWTGLNQLPSQRTQHDNMTWYLLSEIPHRVNACDMTLQMVAKLPRRQYAEAKLSGPETLPTTAGGFLNIDTFAFQVQGENIRIATQTDLGVSAFNGLWRSKHAFLRDGSRRLDSHVRWDLQRSQTALVIGDILNNGLGLNPDVRFGGVSWGSDFSQRPEIATYPLPSIQGDAALPSSVELFVDGQLRQSNRLSSGPYAIETQSGINGAGNINVIIRDALGRETQISQPFYTSPKLLRAGLIDYQIDMGRLREGFATDQDEYTSGFFSARWRQGTETWGTWGLRTDIQDHSESLQGDWLISHERWGLFQTGWGVSHDNDLGWGRRGLLGYEWLSANHSLQLQASASSPAFIELGRAPGALAKSLRAQTGWRLSPSLSMSLGWSDEHRRDRERIQLSTVSLSQHVSADRQFFTSLIHSPSFGLNSSVGISQRMSQAWLGIAQLSHREEDGLGLQLNVSWQPTASAWSGRVASEVRSHEHVNQASLLYLGDHGNISVGLGDRNGVTSAQTSVSTTVAWIPNNVFWSKRIPSSFVVIDAGAPDVTIYSNNQPVGKTDAQGQHLLTDVWPYQTTAIRLGWESLPISQQLGDMEREIRPPRGVAMLALANADPQYSEAWHARLSSGELLPTGSRLMRDEELANLPSGLEGLVYVPARWRGHALSVSLPDARRCLIDHLPQQSNTQELTCQLVP